MCRRVECAQCHKPTYAGCGLHIEQMLGDVPPHPRCTCKAKPAPKVARKSSESGSP